METNDTTKFQYTTCEFGIKKNDVIYCMCSNLGRGLINGKPTNVANRECLKNPNCYYKLWKREQNKQ
ncbi:MAG: hypothetical protein Q4E83_03785 [bacterium]|nr:hypothetical protein [bacterium]